MSTFKESAVTADTAISLKAMSQSLRKQATALSELAETINDKSSPRDLSRAGLAAGFQARELESLAGHLHTLETYLVEGE